MGKSFNHAAGIMFGGAALVAAMTVASGCASYVNYPPIGEDFAVNDPNVAPVPQLVEMAVAHVVELHPVDGAFVVNLPQGMTRANAIRIVERISSDAEIVLPDNAVLPTYHVSRFWLRGDRATVDVLRPVTDVEASGSAAGQPVVQAVTVKLTKSSFSPWRVGSTHAWTIGSATPPERFGWPEDFTAPPAESAPESTQN